MYGTLSQSLYLWKLEEQRGDVKSHKGRGAIFIGPGVDLTRDHDLVSLPELYLLIQLFQPLFNL